MVEYALLDNQDDRDMSTLTITLDERLEADLREVVASTGSRRTDFAREALRRQLALAKLKLLRKEMAPYARARGWSTEEDVFRDVS